MRTYRNATFALIGLLAMLPVGLSASDLTAARQSAREAVPSRAGYTPSSAGSRQPSPPSPAPASAGSRAARPASPTPSSGTAARQPDDRRGDARHRPGAHSGGGSGHGHGHGYWGGYYGYGYGYGYYPYYWGWGPWWAGYGYYDGPYPGRRGGEAGALDIDVSPGRTEVWVNGDYVGTADDYDGFPTFLWLPTATYDVVFYREGFRTLARQYTVYPGLIIDVEDDMEPGEAVRPETLVPPSTERRDARLRDDRETAEEVEAREREDQEWRERRDPSEEAAVAARTGSVVLRLDPSDASVYLDGSFIGTGGDLERLPRGLAVEAGVHQLDVVRPGYVAVRRGLRVEEGEAVEVEVVLEPSDD